VEKLAGKAAKVGGSAMQETVKKEYIERGAALGEFDKVCDICMALVKNPMCGDCSIADTVRKVKHIPAADVVEVRYGRWIEDACGAIWCSNCSHTEESCEQKMFHYRYCPNCGAKMDGGADDGKAD
jgi:hypothetical protein